MNREKLLYAIEKYDPWDEEKAFPAKFKTLLTHANAYQRSHLPGHITGSAWIIDETKSYVLLTHHAKLNKWLQPGGHSDGEENILSVALREAREETGLTDFGIISAGVFDLDIHPIPAHRDFPQHWHYDVRFAFQADKAQPLVVTNESHALSWIPLRSLAQKTEGNTSILRMGRKTELLP